MASDDDDKSLGSLIRSKKQNGSAPKLMLKKEELDNGGSDNPKPKLRKPIAKKEESDSDFDDYEKPLSCVRPRKAPVKKEEKNDDDNPLAKKSSISKPDKNVKRKREEAAAAAVAATPEKKKREKKVYDLPGQKRDPPDERDPLRIFYETLYEQLPHSEMAQVWLMESGLLPKEEAKKVFEKKQKNRQLQKVSSPSKPVASVRKTTTVSTPSRGGSSVKKTITKTTTSVTVKKKTAPASKGTSNKKRKKDAGSSSESESDDDYDDDFVSERSKQKKAA